jgi:hypothetical protein
MKERPSSWDAIIELLKKTIEPGNVKRSFSRLVDDGFVKLGIIPEIMDGAGKILHLSDTPTNMYGYLARTLRRINPSVVVHTGDLADEIKLGMYPSEAGSYSQAVKKLFNILLAPHRTVVIALGNHDRADLFPPLSSQCIVCDNVTDLTFYGAKFRISHYVENVMDKPERYNLFGHDPASKSFVDDDGRYFLNGIEIMRVIDPVVDDIKFIMYPRRTQNARTMRRGRLAK